MDEATLAARASDVERRMRELITQADLPAPDAVERHDDEMWFLWDDTKTVVIVELEDPPDDAPGRSRP